MRNIQSRPEISEKEIEKHLVKAVAERGGLALKYSNPNMAGYPDRLCMIPSRCADKTHVFFVELKSKGRKPTALQCMRMEELRRMGVLACVCDSKESVDEIIGAMT